MNADYFEMDDKDVKYGAKCNVCREQLPYGSLRCLACHFPVCSEQCRGYHDLKHAGLEPTVTVVPRLPDDR